jgi:hypothetical protein
MRVLQALCLTALACAPATAASIEGRVTNSVTGEPVISATVRIVDRHSFVQSTITDSSGTYRVTGLDDGDYRSEVSKDGFSIGGTGTTQTLEQVLSGGAGRFVHLSGDVPVRVDVQLNPWGEIRGRVTNEDGEPAAKVPLVIGGIMGAPITDITDENGEFAIGMLAPGSYTVAAKPKPATRMRDGERVGAVSIYYPSATQLAGAVAIPVTWGADVAGIEIRLRDVPVHRVMGVVLDEDGKPAAKADVKLLGRAPPVRISGVGFPMLTNMEPREGGIFIRARGAVQGPVVSTASASPGPEPEMARVQTKDDGTFEFAAVERGDWRVAAETGRYDRPRAAVVSVTVAEEDVEAVVIRLTTPFIVPRTVDWGDAKAPPGWEQVAGFFGLRAMEDQPSPAVGPDGKGVLGDFGGRYRVGRDFVVPKGFYVAAVMLGGVDVLGQVVDLAPGSGPFQSVMRHDAGSLRGTVENGEGGSVFLVPRTIGETIDYFSIGVGAGGAFEFKDVPPGEYYAVAFDQPNMRQLPGQDLPDSIAPMAAGVTIAADAEGMVNLKVNKWPY